MWQVCTLRGHEQGAVSAVDFSPDGKLVVIGSSFSESRQLFLKIWDTQTGAEVSIVVGVRGKGVVLMAFRACCATLEVPLGGATKLRRL